MGGTGHDRLREARASGKLGRSALLFAAAAAILTAPALASSRDKPGHDSKPAPGTDPALALDKAITITKESDLQFGRVVIIGNGGSVMLPADGFPIYSSLIPLGTNPSRARFEIHGPANKSIQVQLTFPLSGPYGSSGQAKLDTLSVSADYTTGFKQDGSLVRLKLDSGGMNAITVGGKLTFNSANNTGKTIILIPISVALAK